MKLVSAILYDKNLNHVKNLDGMIRYQWTDSFKNSTTCSLTMVAREFDMSDFFNNYSSMNYWIRLVDENKWFRMDNLELGGEEVVIQGKTHLGFMATRRVWPNQNDDTFFLSADPGEIVRTLIDNNITDNSISTVGTRKGIYRIGENDLFGQVVDFKSNWQSLDVALQPLLKTYNLGLRFIPMTDEFGKNYFQVDIKKPTNRSQTVWFSDEALSPEYGYSLNAYSVDNISHRNVVHVSSGTDANYQSVIVNDSVVDTDRFETSLTYSAVTQTETTPPTQQQLIEFGEQELTTNYVKKENISVTLNIIESDEVGYRYGVDYQIGDVVGFVNKQWGFTAALMVESVSGNRENGVLTYTINLGDGYFKMGDIVRQINKEN